MSNEIENEILTLTENNLITLKLKESVSVSEKVKEVKPKGPKKPAKMSETQREKRIEEYNNYWSGFSNDEDAEIYDKLVKIAKKQYSKDEALANFEEEFYQHFMLNDDYDYSKKKINRYYCGKAHQKLINLRQKAESVETL